VTQITSADPADENSFDQPGHIVPVTSPFPAPGSRFTRTLPPWSVTVFRIPLNR
jgi:alpha-L-arabinofuranosidase